MITLPKAITFDCYGTLIDWEAEIQQFFAQRLAAKGVEGIDTKALQAQWEEIQFHYIQQQYRSYRISFIERLAPVSAIGVVHSESIPSSGYLDIGRGRRK